jgi:hypothetical protein
MVKSLKKVGVIVLVAFIGLITAYTALMSAVFSFDGMWISETNLMIWYTVVFAISAYVMVLFAKKDWIQTWMG